MIFVCVEINVEMLDNQFDLTSRSLVNSLILLLVCKNLGILSFYARKFIHSFESCLKIFRWSLMVIGRVGKAYGTRIVRIR